MDQSRLSDSTSEIKFQLASQEILFQYLSKVEAMVEILLAKDLIDYPSAKLHDYLLVISDLVDKARTLNEDLIGRMVRLYSLFSIFEESVS